MNRKKTNKPFTLILNEDVRSPNLKPNEKLVFLAILSAGNGWKVSYEKLAEWTLLSRRTVANSVKSLIGKGSVVVKQKGRCNTYYAYTTSAGGALYNFRPVQITTSTSAGGALSIVQEVHSKKTSFKRIDKKEVNKVNDKEREKLKQWRIRNGGGHLFKSMPK